VARGKWIFIARISNLFRWPLAFVTATLASGSCAHVARPSQERVVHRGAVIRRGQSVLELARGPGLVHIYSEATGGTVYVAPAVPGASDRCSVPGVTLAEAPLEPDRRLTVALREGEVVCVQMQVRHTVEVLWHLHSVSPGTQEYRLRRAAWAKRP
jgi:hypothetical protein